MDILADESPLKLRTDAFNSTNKAQSRKKQNLTVCSILLGMIYRVSVVQQNKTKSTATWQCWYSCNHPQSYIRLHFNQGRNEVDGARARNNFGALCSNLRSFGSKPKKALLALLGFSAPPRNHSAPTAVIRRPGNCAPLPTSLRLWFQLAQERCWPWLPSCHGNKVLISRKKSQKALKKAKHKTYT